MYRVGIETLLGLTLTRGALHIDPCIPHDWPQYQAVVRTLQAEFHVVVENPEGVTRGVRVVELDGTRVQDDISLADAVGTHEVRVVLGRSSTA
jgi:cyclic beta-1,2-glucan synthetase